MATFIVTKEQLYIIAGAASGLCLCCCTVAAILFKMHYTSDLERAASMTATQISQNGSFSSPALSQPSNPRRRSTYLDPNDVYDLEIHEDHRAKRISRASTCTDVEKQIHDLNDGMKSIIVESVPLNQDDERIQNDFHSTIDSVEVIEMKRIKDNVSMKVYGALLTAKTEELKTRNVGQVERVLFHGTSFENVAKIVNNGFNRDFNRVHKYGKGTYFSSSATVSAGYCKCDDADDPSMKVMLVCKVIVGESHIGWKGINGSNWPLKEDQKTQYESLVDREENPSIFVIHRDYHAIPTHIITFKHEQR